MDSQEIQEVDLPSQSVSMTDSDCIGADSSVMQSHLLMPTSIQCLEDIDDTLVRDIQIDACTPQMGDSCGTIDYLGRGLEETFSAVESAVFADIASECSQLMYELLHVMPESAEAVGAVISFLARSGMEQGEIVLEVSRRLQDLQGMCVTSTSHACVWTYTGAGQPDAHDRRQPPVGKG